MLHDSAALCTTFLHCPLSRANCPPFFVFHLCLLGVSLATLKPPQIWSSSPPPLLLQGGGIYPFSPHSPSHFNRLIINLTIRLFSVNIPPSSIFFRSTHVICLTQFSYPHTRSLYCGYISHNSLNFDRIFSTVMETHLNI